MTHVGRERMARVGAKRTVKRTGAIGVYMGMARHFPYKSGLAGVYPGNDMSSTRAFMLIELPAGGYRHRDPHRYKNRKIM